MKSILLILSIVVFAAFTKSPEYAPWAQPTKNYDTLYLLKNSADAKVLYGCWEKDSTWDRCHPCIVFVDSVQLISIKKRVLR